MLLTEDKSLFFIFSIEEDNDDTHSMYKHKVSIMSDGQCAWLNPVTLKTICRVDVSYFPFDDQKCGFKFGSWAMDASKIDMQASNTTSNLNSYYIPNGEWELYGSRATRHELYYQCCKNPYVDVTIEVELRRHALNYTFNYIIPAALLSSLILLGFVLPPESGERIGLSITVLLSVTVFQQLSSAKMPAYDFPYLAQYYFSTMIQTGFSLFATTMVLNFYHRSNRKMPPILRKILLQWLGKILFCGKTIKYDDVIDISFVDRKKKTRNKGGWNDQTVLNMNGDASDHESNEDGTERNGVNKEKFKMFRKNPIQRAKSMIARRSSCANNTYYPRKRGNQTCISEVLESALDATAFSLLEQQSKYSINDENKKRKEQVKRERQKEWIRGARVLDRFFMALFIVMSLASLLTIFMRAPRFRVRLT